MSAIPGLVMLAGLFAAPPGAAAPAADAAGPEAVLAGKGLARSGKVYLLPRVEAALRALGLDAPKPGQLPMPTDLVFPGGDGPGGMPSPPPDEGMRSRMPGPSRGGGPGGDGGGLGIADRLSRLDDAALADALAAGRAGIERLRPGERAVLYDYLGRRLVARYNAVAADPEVRAALLELNRGRSPRLAVGPAWLYEERVKADATATLRGKGLKAGKVPGTYAAALDDDLSAALAEADRARSELEKAEARSDAEAAGRKAKSARDPAGSSPAALRREYVRRVADLRKLADDAQGRHRDLPADPDVKEALAVLDKHVPKQKPHRFVVALKFADGLKHLATLEGPIETIKVPLEPDRDASWVEADLNDSRGLRMVLDPGSPHLRLPARVAAEVGAQLSDAPEVDATTDDGRTFPARRGTIGSLRVGSFQLRDVPCLVLPASFGDPPPLLGSAVLDRFVADVDDPARTLTLVRVGPRPSAKPPTAALTRPAAKP